MRQGTKGYYRFTDGTYICPSVRTVKLHLQTVNRLYHRYRRYRWTRFSRATSCLGITSRHHRILQIYGWCIHLSIRTDGQPSFTDGKLPLPSVPSVPSVPMDMVFKGNPVPWDNVKAPKDITDLPMVYTSVHRYGQTNFIYGR